MAITHPGEESSNQYRSLMARFEPKALRTFTPSQAVIAKSAGIYHWTPEGRRLYDFSSGVLVANLGHNPKRWMSAFRRYMGWPVMDADGEGYFEAAPMTAYNAATPVEIEASRRLIELLRSRSGGGRLEQVFWAASGSEAIQKALWAAMAKDPKRDMILATRYGFHGKKGLAGAVTGSEADRERDPRVRFISFPREESADISMRDVPFDPSPYLVELDNLWLEHGSRIGTLITEPYLGGGGSYHPPIGYMQALQGFCRKHDLMFILDEVQSNFGRTSALFAFEHYGLEPDLVVLGKGLGNGVPVAAVAGGHAVLDCLGFGEGSDTWSANPLCCAAVLATLDEFADGEVLSRSRVSSTIIEAALARLKRLPIVSHIRGEKGGMVWGIEAADHRGIAASEWANRIVLACYRGQDNEGIHLLGPLAGKVVRVAPPIVISEEQAEAALRLMDGLLSKLAES